MDLADQPLGKAGDLHYMVTNSMFERRRVVVRCERAHQSSLEVLIAADEVVERLRVHVSPPSIESLVLDRMRLERAQQDLDNHMKKMRAMEGLAKDGPARSPYTFEKCMQGFSWVRGMSLRIL